MSRDLVNHEMSMVQTGCQKSKERDKIWKIANSETINVSLANLMRVGKLERFVFWLAKPVIQQRCFHFIQVFLKELCHGF